jgi:hypothetical protein
MRDAVRADGQHTSACLGCASSWRQRPCVAAKGGVGREHKASFISQDGYAQRLLFTSESVSEGHPDKVADQISDAIVDLFLSKDPEARIACETLTTTQLVVLAGEIRCKGVYENGAWADGAQEEIEKTVRETVKRIGLSAGRLPLGDLRVHQPPARPVGAYRAGRGRGRQQGRGRGRPGHHVRFRL